MMRITEGGLRAIKGTWQIFVRMRPEEGGAWKTKAKMTDIPCGGERSERAARKELVKWRDELVRADAVEDYKNAGGEMGCDIKRALGIDEEQLSRRFEDYARDALSARSRRPSSAEGASHGGNLDILRRWVMPYLPNPDVTVRDLTPEMVNRTLQRLSESGKSPRTVQKALGVIKSVTSYADHVHGLRPDPCYGVRIPEQVMPRRNHMEVAQAERLSRTLAVMPQTDVVFAARLALACGICEGEVSALQIYKADPETMEGIHINCSLGNEGGFARGTHKKSPKNRFRDRVIPMNDEIRDVLRSRITRLHEECSKAGSQFNENLYLTGRPDGSWLTPGNLGKKWGILARSLGAMGVHGDPLTFHDLRHTFATTFLAKGGAINDLMRILGHSTATMALQVYAGSDPTVRAEAMRKVSRPVVDEGSSLSPVDVLSGAADPLVKPKVEERAGMSSARRVT